MIQNSSQTTMSVQGKTTSLSIVVNACYGGFYLSEEGAQWIAGQMGVDVSEIDRYCISRTDSWLVKLVQYWADGEDDDGNEFSINPNEMGASRLIVEEVSAEVAEANAWDIDEYDGLESVVVYDCEIELFRKKKAEQRKKEKLEAEVGGRFDALRKLLEVLYDDGDTVTPEKKLKALQGLFPAEAADVLMPNNTVETVSAGTLEERINRVLSLAGKQASVIPCFGDDVGDTQGIFKA